MAHPGKGIGKIIPQQAIYRLGLFLILAYEYCDGLVLILFSRAACTTSQSIHLDLVIIISRVPYNFSALPAKAPAGLNNVDRVDIQYSIL